MYKTIEQMIEVYDKHKNLKIAGEDLGMPWQTVYWHLTKAGHPVTGDKERYGSDTDKLARVTEKLFNKLIPYAKDNNEHKFQAKSDFNVKGFKVDVKASTKKDGYKSNPRKNPAFRWAFCCNVQEMERVDFLVLYCYSGYDVLSCGDIEKILLIPKEMFKNKQSISVSCNRSKWEDFEVTEDELKIFFDMI